MKIAIVLCFAQLTLLGQTVASRHDIRPAAGGKTGAAAREVGQRYLETTAARLYERSAPDLAGMYLVKEYRTAHNGVTHLVYRQQFQGADVQGSDFTINIDANGDVINSGGMIYAAPAAGLLAPLPDSASPALQAAVKHVRGKDPGTGYLRLARPEAGSKGIRMARAAAIEEFEGEPIWFPFNGALRPAWRFWVTGEDGVDNYETIVDSVSGRVLGKSNLTWYQSAQAKGLVFGQSPQPNPTPGTAVASPRPYVDRTSQSFAGDPVASPKGWVTNNQTAGNNVVAAPNPLGIRFLSPNQPVVATNGDFSFPLELGPGTGTPGLYSDAATTNLFYWANKAHDWFYSVGFDEQAGNYQQDNFNKGGVGGDPMQAFSQFGKQTNTSATLNNAFYTTPRAEDGSRGSINMYLGSSSYQQARGDRVYTDGSYDAEVIVHEYTHGVSLRLVRNLSGAHGGAMGEATSDFFALEFTTPEGADPNGVYPTGEYLFQAFGTGLRTRPYSTRMDINPLTFAQLGSVTASGPEVHADGEIWCNTLWELRAALIQQFGEREGRRRIRLLVIDGMKLAPPSPTMVDMRDAILLADQVDFKGASQDQLWEAFAKRGFGALAYAPNAGSMYISASYEKPGKTGMLKLYESQYYLGQSVRVLLSDLNNTANTAQVQLTTSAGDLENIMLRKNGNLFVASMSTTTAVPMVKGDSILQAVPWDSISAYYVDRDTGSGSKLIEVTSETSPNYTGYYVTRTPGGVTAASNETALGVPAGTLGASTRVSLPFSFPFYGKKYSQVWLNTSGVLTFGRPYTEFCMDRSSLLPYRAIAPFALDLTFGAAQKGENIYLSAGSDWVKFRWAAELAQPAAGSAQPVNFAVTLWNDGRVQTTFGTDSGAMANDPNWAAPCSPFPTMAISAGDESYSIAATQPLFYDTLPDLQWRPPWGFSSLPTLKLETPQEGATAQDLLNVSGIAYDENTIQNIWILIDGQQKATASVNTTRTDFCSTQNVPGCPRVGFSTNLNLATLGITPGKHTLAIRAVNSRGAVSQVPDTPVNFTVQAGSAAKGAVVLETSLPAELTGSLTLRGFAYSTNARISGVDVQVDGVTITSGLAYGQSRADICDPLAAPKPANCPAVGFQGTLAVGGASFIPNGKHTLQIRARDEFGRYLLSDPTPIVVNVKYNGAPVGVLETPKPAETLSGTVTIKGYAYWPGSSVRAATLYVDGYPLAGVSYGASRPDVCAALPDVSACPRIGFSLNFDTRVLSNGPHILGVLLSSAGGDSYMLPANTLNDGMNVVVQN